MNSNLAKKVVLLVVLSAFVLLFTMGGCSKETPCMFCDGSGRCKHCHGSGRYEGYSEGCPICHGSGKCVHCKGTGKDFGGM